MAFLLVFTLCSTTPDPSTGSAGCEMGEIVARSCAAAERYLRAALLPHHTLHISSCEVVA